MAKIIGLDLGAYSVKALHLETKGKAYEVMDFAEVPLSTGGTDTLAERQLAALRELKAGGHLDGSVFITGLPADAAAVRTLHFPFSDPRKIEETLPYDLEAEVPFDIEDIVMSWDITGTSLNEAGISQTDVMVAYARRDAMEAHLELLTEAGIDPRQVRFQAVALEDLYKGVFDESIEMALLGQEALRTPGGTVVQFGEGAADPAIAIVDIGKRATTIAIFAESKLIAAHTILHGGDDATRALAKALNLPPEEAERGKRKEAFIETATARAQFDQQTQVSDILKEAYAPIARRLRQIFQSALSDHKVRIIRVVLTGGGSRIINLDRHFAEVLNTTVVRAGEIEITLGAARPLEGGGEAPQAAMALAYAISGAAGEKSIDFRQKEFAWKGDFDFIRDKAASLALWAMVLLAILVVTSGIKAYGLSSEESELRAQQEKACESITGKKIESVTTCLAIIQERINAKGTTGVPEWSAADTFIEISKRMPRDTVLIRKVLELDIDDERVRMKARTSDFDAVDKIITALQKGRCFEQVEKGKARQVEAGVEFPATIRLNCTIPGEAEFDWVKAVPKMKLASNTPKRKVKKARKPTKTVGSKPILPADRAQAARDRAKAALEERREKASTQKASVLKRAEARKALRDGDSIKEAVKKARGSMNIKPTREFGISPIKNLGVKDLKPGEEEGVPTKPNADEEEEEE